MKINNKYLIEKELNNILLYKLINNPNQKKLIKKQILSQLLKYNLYDKYKNSFSELLSKLKAYENITKSVLVKKLNLIKESLINEINNKLENENLKFKNLKTNNAFRIKFICDFFNETKILEFDNKIKENIIKENIIKEKVERNEKNNLEEIIFSLLIENGIIYNFKFSINEYKENEIKFITVVKINNNNKFEILKSNKDIIKKIYLDLIFNFYKSIKEFSYEENIKIEKIMGYTYRYSLPLQNLITVLFINEKITLKEIKNLNESCSINTKKLKNEIKYINYGVDIDKKLILSNILDDKNDYKLNKSFLIEILWHLFSFEKGNKLLDLIPKANNFKKYKDILPDFHVNDEIIKYQISQYKLIKVKFNKICKRIENKIIKYKKNISLNELHISMFHLIYNKKHANKNIVLKSMGISDKEFSKFQNLISDEDISKAVILNELNILQEKLEKNKLEKFPEYYKYNQRESKDKFLLETYNFKIKQYKEYINYVFKEILKNKKYDGILNKIIRKEVKLIYNEQFKGEITNKLWVYSIIKEIILEIGRLHFNNSGQNVIRLPKHLNDMIDGIKDIKTNGFIKFDFFTICSMYYELNSIKKCKKNRLLINSKIIYTSSLYENYNEIWESKE